MENISVSNTTDSQAGSQDPDERPNNSVSYESHKKLLRQHKAMKMENESLQAQINEMKAVQEAEAQAKLEDEKRFEELFRTEQEKSRVLQEEKSQILQDALNERKRNILKAELGGVQRDDYLKFADLSKIAVKDDGSIDMDSVQEVANEFRRDHSVLLKQDTSMLPANAPSQPGMITYEKWLTLPAGEKAKQLPNVIKKG